MIENNRINWGKERADSYHCDGFRRQRRSGAEDSRIAILQFLAGKWLG